MFQLNLRQRPEETRKMFRIFKNIQLREKKLHAYRLVYSKLIFENISCVEASSVDSKEKEQFRNTLLNSMEMVLGLKKM